MSHLPLVQPLPSHYGPGPPPHVPKAPKGRARPGSHNAPRRGGLPPCPPPRGAHIPQCSGVALPTPALRHPEAGWLFPKHTAENPSRHPSWPLNAPPWRPPPRPTLPRGGPPSLTFTLISIVAQFPATRKHNPPHDSSPSSPRTPTPAPGATNVTSSRGAARGCSSLPAAGEAQNYISQQRSRPSRHWGLPPARRGAYWEL